MHPLLFGVKRVQNLVLRWTAAWFEETDVYTTPARFDLMRVVYVHTEGLPRWRLVRMLGVSGPVVSRMLKALEKQGLLIRTREPSDRRVVVVSLTEEGKALVAHGLESFVECGDFIGGEVRTWFVGDDAPDKELEIVHNAILRARWTLGEHTPLAYPWQCVEIRPEGYFLEIERPPPTKWDQSEATSSRASTMLSSILQ